MFINPLKAFDSKFEKIQNSFLNQSCYIFGSGPSIKWFDLKKFCNYPSIVVGQMHYHVDFNYLDVKAFCLVEPWIFIPPILQNIFDKHLEHRKHLKSIKPIIKDYKKFMRLNKNKNFILSLSNFPFINGKNIFYVNKKFPDINGYEKKIRSYYLFGGSFYAGLSTAYLMGFKNVYLVGFDAWTMTPTRNIRYFEKGKGLVESNVPKPNPIINLFKNKMNISVITHEGYSPLFNNLSYYDMTGEKPNYKENKVIIGQKYLEMLSKTGIYKI